MVAVPRETLGTFFLRPTVGAVSPHTGKGEGKDRIFLAGAKGKKGTLFPEPDGLAAELLNYEY